jgi:DNA-binding NarL/FixJ family response regulator
MRRDDTYPKVALRTAPRSSNVNRRSIKLVIADDHPVVLAGLVSLVRNESDFRVLAACEDGAKAVEAVIKHAPDIALLDLRLPDMSGLEVLDEILRGNLPTRVVILTAFSDDREVLLAISHGVHGMIMKDSVASTLIECLRLVFAGGRCVPPELVKRELNRQAKAASIVQSLTSREQEVLRLVANGRSIKDVAALLNISAGTLKLHLHHIYRKTNVSGRAALMTLAWKFLDG